MTDGGVEGRSELPDYVERYLQGDTMALEEVNEAFELMHRVKVFAQLFTLINNLNSG